jgi:hypothetical protein
MISPLPHCLLGMKLHKECLHKKGRNINIREMKYLFRHKNLHHELVGSDVYKSYTVHVSQTVVKKEQNEAFGNVEY